MNAQCLDTLQQAVKLPCSHAICCDYLKQLRQPNVGTVCPMCRATLPPGPEIAYAEASTLHVRFMRAENQTVKERLQQRAMELFQAAAAQGSAHTQRRLATGYMQGHGVVNGVVDTQRAMGLYEAAAAQGHAGAKPDLGICHMRGQGVVKGPKCTSPSRCERTTQLGNLLLVLVWQRCGGRQATCNGAVRSWCSPRGCRCTKQPCKLPCRWRHAR